MPYQGKTRILIALSPILCGLFAAVMFYLLAPAEIMSIGLAIVIACFVGALVGIFTV